MKKNYFLGSLMFLSASLFAQKTVIVNGGQYGNQSENANVIIYNTATSMYNVIDTIQTQSVQEVLMDWKYAFVAAQDSIVKYDVTTEQRVAANAFKGVSTKSFALSNNYLLAGNWYGQSTNNLYLYDKHTLAFVDSIPSVSKGAVSILTHNGMAYISQNESSSNFTDTLGYIVVLDIANRNIVDTIRVSSYSKDIGVLVKRPNGLGFHAINSESNSIATIDYATNTVVGLTQFTQNLQVRGRAQYAIDNDTIFLKMSNKIAAINLNNLGIINSNIIDTMITAFTYDRLNKEFYLTQTDFVSFRSGGRYNRNGNKISSVVVGYSPEAIGMNYAGTTIGFAENTPKELVNVFPNPSEGTITIEEEINAKLTLFNNLGQEVKTVNLSAIKQQIDLTHLDKGIYFMQLSKNGAVKTEKLVIR